MRIDEFKNIHQGQRCFIVCNGPHLNDIDPALLDGEITIGLNRICLKPELKIDYLCVMAYQVKRHYMDEIVEAPVKTIFATLKRPEVVYMNMAHLKPRRFAYDLENKVIGKGSGVTYLAMHIAYWMGCDPVYIIGMDHEWSLDNCKRRSRELVIATGPDINHFHPEYFDIGVVWAYYDKMTEHFEEGFKLAADAYAAKGRTLLNASTYTKLSEDVIPRVNFHEII